MKNLKICRLCLKACNANFLPVQGSTKEILDALLVKMDLDISKAPVKCKECIDNLQKCFEFKSVCIHTEKNVVAFLESKHVYKANMTEVFLKDVKSNSALPKTKEVCRFCARPVTKFFTIDDLDKAIDFSNMLQKFLPEVNLCVTNKPVSCNDCLGSIKCFSNFLKNCQDVEDYIKAYCKAENITKIKVELNNLVQYIMKRNIFKCVTESGISRLKKDIIHKVTITKDQLVETSSSELVKYDYSDSVKTEVIKIEEQIIEINSPEFIDINAITTKEELDEKFPSDSSDKGTVIHKEQLDEIYVSVPDDEKKYVMEEGSTIDLPSEEIKKENSDDDVFSEGSSDENNADDVDMTKVKMEDVDIEPNNLDVERDVPFEEVKKEISDNDVFSEGSNDESNTEDIDMTKIKMVDIEPASIDVERNEGSSKWLQCSYCKYKTNQRGHFNYHLKIIHDILFFSCHRCRYKTRDEDCLKKHQVIHGDNAKFECPQCHKVFSSKKYIDDHFLRKHDNLSDMVTSKIHSCNNCSFKTSDKSRLLNHVNQNHLHLKKFQCNHCSRTFCQKSVLKRHISSIHLNLRPHICKNCKETFNQKISLVRHIVSHHQEDLDLMKTVTNKVHNCDRCTFKCVLKREMEAHMKTHDK